MKLRAINAKDVNEGYQITLSTREGSYTREGMTAAGITEESVLRMLEVERSHHGWVCEVEGKVVGIAMGNKITGEFWVIAVLPEFERQGIGTALADAVEAWLLSEGWHEIWLAVMKDVQVAGYSFFKSRGWADGEDRGPFRFMKKKI